MNTYLVKYKHDYLTDQDLDIEFRIYIKADDYSDAIIKLADLRIGVHPSTNQFNFYPDSSISSIEEVK